MRFGVVRFPGSNCDDDALHVVTRVLATQGASGRFLWHKDDALGEVDAVLLPGGFSYGDYLRAGAIAAHSPIMAAVKAFVDKEYPGVSVSGPGGTVEQVVGRDKDGNSVVERSDGSQYTRPPKAGDSYPGPEITEPPGGVPVDLKKLRG